MTLRWPEAERVDEARLDAMVALCPLCRRPCSVEPLDGIEAMRRLGRHLRDAHDPTFAAILRNHLTPAPAPDPFFPTDASW